MDNKGLSGEPDVHGTTEEAAMEGTSTINLPIPGRQDEAISEETMSMEDEDASTVDSDPHQQKGLEIHLVRDVATINKDQLSGGKGSRMKYVSLVSLTGQNVLEAIAVRHSRTRVPSEKLYMNTTATAVVEVFKLAASVLLLAKEERGLLPALQRIYSVVRKDFVDTCKVALISLIYVIQNNFLFVGASHLEVATFQACYQLKLLTTALVFAILLKKKLSFSQWTSLSVLLAGVVLVKLADPSVYAAKKSQKMRRTSNHQDPALGFLAVVIASFLSAFAGVYFEKVLKSSQISLWLRNVQMSILSIPLALFVSFSQDSRQILEEGFFFGYDEFVWSTMALKASGGLIIGAVIKYADNILKGFSISISLVFGCLANVFIFGVPLSFQFLLGTQLVIVSVFLYNYNPF